MHLCEAAALKIKYKHYNTIKQYNTVYVEPNNSKQAKWNEMNGI